MIMMMMMSLHDGSSTTPPQTRRIIKHLLFRLTGGEGESFISSGNERNVSVWSVLHPSLWWARNNVQSSRYCSLYTVYSARIFFELVRMLGVVCCTQSLGDVAASSAHHMPWSPARQYLMSKWLDVPADDPRRMFLLIITFLLMECARFIRYWYTH